MGIMDVVRQRLTPTILTPRSTNVGPSWDEWWAEITADVHSSSPAKLFRTQPHLYTTVSFLARNVAQLGLHTFERVDETDRRRSRTSAAARALAGTDGTMTTYELIFALVGDLMLYDRAYWFVGDSATLPSGFQIRRIPPAWVTPDEATPFEVLSWAVSLGDKVVRVPAEQMLAFTGYSPTSPLRGSSAVEALRGTLQEQVEAAEYRKQVWKRGGRVSAVIQRPKDAAPWSDAARESFREDWYAKFTGRGPKAGGTPILEDGMTLQRIDFNAQEQQFVEAAKLSLVTVASAFHVNPTMIGQNDGANYSNVREFRKMLYGDTLGPILAQIEARLNAFLLPMLGVDNERFYVEFNIAEKLQGNFEEQATALQTATGAPYMLRSEARALMNLPAIEGADDLVTPLNVLIGGQASPRDSGDQNRNAAPRRQVKARPAEREDDAVALLEDFFSRQSRSVLSRIGAGGEWWDKARWDDELTEVLEELQRATATAAGRSALQDAGIDPDVYDEKATLEFLAEAARRDAEAINETTHAALDESDDPGTVFDQAKAQRVGAIAAGVVTFASGFGAVEAARRSGAATKTWVVTSSNPRATHAAMNGETVGIDDVFSNGLRWPGAMGPADETAGCRCDLQINFPDA